MRAILLDPSCSGSGTVVARGDVLLQSAQVEADSEEADETAIRRLAGLVKFQVRFSKIRAETSSAHYTHTDNLKNLERAEASHAKTATNA